jgi:hypothetical protein
MKKHLMRDTLRRAVPVYLAFMRNGLALVGLTTLMIGATIFTRGPLRAQPETPLSPTLPGNESAFLTGFVGAGAGAGGGMIAEALVASVADATPVTSDLEGRREPDVAPAVLTPTAQAGIARYLARRYHVSADAIGLMVTEAYSTGREVGLDPHLLLAVIGVESGFNPFAESGMGAQGLMQVMAKVHSAKFGEYGGPQAALDPVANIKIGAYILKDCIRRGGSLRDGLRLYVGSTTEEDGGYGLRVMQEKDRIQLAAHGGNPVIVPVASPAAKPLPSPAPTKSAAAQIELQPRAEAVGRAHGKLAAL